jgi:Raf kinase inhibitor-like YbhB/YbcL family protein
MYWSKIMKNNSVRINEQLEKNGSNFVLSSPAFIQDGIIPLKYTCEGEGISPALAWSSGPEGTQSYALIMVDKDVPFSGEFVHWVVFNLPSDCRGLPENFTEIKNVSIGAVIALNGAGKCQYYPPCPVGGTHTYRFCLYALDVEQLSIKISKWRQTIKEIKKHELACSVLNGQYRCARLNIRQAFATNIRLMRR